MNTYVAIIGGKAVLTFRAVDDDQARAMIDDQEGSVRSDLKVLADMDGKPLWDGKSAIQVREATVAQDAEWKRSRDQAIIDGEIDLDVGNNPDEGNVYLMGAPERTRFGAKTSIDRQPPWPAPTRVWPSAPSVLRRWLTEDRRNGQRSRHRSASP
jgi:hypothetical protein